MNEPETTEKRRNPLKRGFSFGRSHFEGIALNIGLFGGLAITAYGIDLWSSPAALIFIGLSCVACAALYARNKQ